MRSYLDYARRYIYAADAYVVGHDKDDLTQEFALAIWRAESNFDASRGSFATYAWGVCRRRHTDLLRKHAGETRKGVKRPTVVQLDPSELAPVSDDERVAARTRLRNVMRTAKQLPAQERAALGRLLLDAPDADRREAHAGWRFRQRLLALGV